MKKSLYLAFIAALALSMGCAISNYPVITDTEGDAAGFVVNTNGKAQIIPSSQGITIFPDRNEELFSLVDQKFSGDQTITTYTNVSFGGSPYKFMGFQYCNPDWTGCAMMTADNPVGGANFVYTTNPNCQGWDGWSVTVSVGSRIAECGRTMLKDFDMVNALTGSMVDLGAGRNGINLNRRTVSLVGQDDMGHSFTMPIMGNHMLVVTDRGFVTTYTPALQHTARAMARVTEENGVSNWTISYLGHSYSFNAIFNTEMAARMAAY
jgi:hypothetical protein